MLRRLSWGLSAVLIVSGVALVLVGFFYDVVYAGIPYPHATPELAARYEFHAAIASAIRTLGAILGVLGIIGTATVGLLSLGRKK